MRFIKKSFLQWSFLFLMGFCAFSFSGHFSFTDPESSFVSSAWADGYSGLTDQEKNYLKSKGYSDQQISNFNEESKKFAETRRDTSSKNDYKYSKEAQGMTKALASEFGSKNLSYVQYANSSEELQQGSVFGAGLAGAARGFWEGLTGTSGMNNYELIHYAFTAIENGCWFCPVFQTLFSTVNSLAAKTNTSLAHTIAGGAGSLLWLLLYGYILYVIGKAFLTSSFKEISGMDLVSQIFMPFLACLIATILINNWKSIYTYLLDPFLIGAIGLGQEIQTNAADSFSGSAGLSGITIDTTCHLSSFGTSSGVASLNAVRFGPGGGVSANFIEVSSSGAAFSNGVGEAIQCFLKTVSHSLIAWMTIGATLMADCWKAKIYFIFPNIQMFIIGLIVFIGSFLIFVSFPLKLLDSIFRLMFVSALMPLWIAFWIIPQTRKYANAAWEMLIHVMVTFVILSVVLAMVLQIIGSVFTKSVSGIDISNLTNLLASDKASDAMQKIDFSGVGIFLATALMYMAFSLIGKAETFVSQFAKGGGNLGIGQAASARVTQGVKNVGNVGVHGVGAASRVTSNTIKNVGSKIASSYRAYRASRTGGGTP